MKILVIGGTGTIGKAIVNTLSPRHDVIAAGYSRGDYQVDIHDLSSIKKLFAQIGALDALITVCGKAQYAELTKLTSDDFQASFNSKLMGQINLCLESLSHLNDHGSITLTSGVLSHDPCPTATAASTVNGALESFTKAAACEAPRGIRINCVSPGLVTGSEEKYGATFRGYPPISEHYVALAYAKSVEGKQSGQIFQVHTGPKDW